MAENGVCVEIISKQTVKPSSRTPSHLNKLNLSYLDQLSRPVYYPIIFFYQSTTSNHSQISLHLQHSLSRALLPFYPLAGRLPADDNSLILCNGAGVEFIHARAQACLADVVRVAAMDELKQLLPLDPTGVAETVDRALFLFQLTFFDCGGIAIGVCFSHQVADCVSAMAIVGAWAETCRRPDQTRDLGINFDLHKYFPPRVSLVSKVPPISPGEKFVTKRFVFDKHKLTILRESASTSSSSSSINPTRVELVSGFIWRSFLKAGRMKDGGKINKIRGAYHVLNLRSRFNPSGNFENVMGNGIMFSFAEADSGCDAEEGYDDLIGRLRRSIRKFDEDYIRMAQNGDDYINYIENLRASDHEYCSFSSWTRFQMYEVDFGWGRPVWCCTTALPAKNLAVLMSDGGGEEIEAWVNMNEYNLEMLEESFHHFF